MPLIIKSIEGGKNGTWWSCPQTETMVLTSVYSSDCARKNAQPWTAETQFRSGANYWTTERL